MRYVGQLIMGESIKRGFDFRGRAGLRVAQCALSFLTIFSCTLAIAQANQRAVAGSIAATSDYVYRGVSLSYGRVAYQGGVHAQLPGQWQVGVWGSTIEVPTATSTPFEATAFLAHTWMFAQDWSVRAGAIHYAYFRLPTQLDYDYDEVFTAVSYQSRLLLGLSWMPRVPRYQPGQPALHAATTAVDATWAQPLLLDWSATIGLGYYDLSALYDTGYAYWHVGLTGPVGPFELDLLHINSDSDARYIYGELRTGPRWSATLRWRF
jgi:uncharacterized protein (TIGR02001 family)